jgi:hypothetical protein
MGSLAASPLALLDKHCSLRLVTDAVHEDDALCLALTCRALRDALWARFRAWLAWGHCDMTGASLTLGDVWYHKIGKLYDVCGAAFGELAGDERDGFVRVTCGADLGVRLVPSRGSLAVVLGAHLGYANML